MASGKLRSKIDESGQVWEDVSASLTSFTLLDLTKLIGIFRDVLDEEANHRGCFNPVVSYGPDLLEYVDLHLKPRRRQCFLEQADVTQCLILQPDTKTVSLCGQARETRDEGNTGWTIGTYFAKVTEDVRALNVVFHHDRWRLHGHVATKQTKQRIEDCFDAHVHSRNKLCDTTAILVGERFQCHVEHAAVGSLVLNVVCNPRTETHPELTMSTQWSAFFGMFCRLSTICATRLSAIMAMLALISPVRSKSGNRSL